MATCDCIRAASSQARLEALIAQRAKKGADKEAIDARIWNLFGERWAVMFTDLSGFSRNVAEFGIVHFLQVIHESHRLLVPIIGEHDGILLKLEGDSMLVMFRNPRRAVDCSIAMQHKLETYNRRRPAAEKVLLCVGLGYGDVLRIGDDDVFGAEVNAASKLGEDTAGPKEILVTDAVRESIGRAKGLRYTRLPEAPPGASGAWKLAY